MKEAKKKGRKREKNARMKYKTRKERFVLYEADTPPTLLPCLQSRQPSLNPVDIDSGCSSNNKGRDVALWRE